MSCDLPALGCQRGVYLGLLQRIQRLIPSIPSDASSPHAQHAAPVYEGTFVQRPMPREVLSAGGRSVMALFSSRRLLKVFIQNRRGAGRERI